MWVCHGAGGCGTANSYRATHCRRCQREWTSDATSLAFTAWRCTTCGVANAAEDVSLVCVECHALHPGVKVLSTDALAEDDALLRSAAPLEDADASDTAADGGVVRSEIADDVTPDASEFEDVAPTANADAVAGGVATVEDSLVSRLSAANALLAAPVVSATLRRLLDVRQPAKLAAAMGVLLPAIEGHLELPSTPQTDSEAQQRTQVAAGENRRRLFGDTSFVVAAAAHTRARGSLDTATGRRLLALGRRLSVAAGLVAPVPPGRCVGCFGSHAPALCPVVSPAGWECPQCRHPGRNPNHGNSRYVCHHCLAVRPSLSAIEHSSTAEDALPGAAEVWECRQCERYTPTVDDTCKQCGWIRPPLPTDADYATQRKRRLRAAALAQPAASCPPGGDESAATDLEEPTLLPLAPSRCGACSGVFLEALCPECNDATDDAELAPRGSDAASSATHLSASSGTRQDVRDGSGVVCAVVGADYALIQPWGTTGRHTRVFIPSSLLVPSLCRIGQAVAFDAARTAKGLRATTVRCVFEDAPDPTASVGALPLAAPAPKRRSKPSF